MDHLKEDILGCLKDLRGSGKFISAHTTEFVFPGLEVEGVGEIAYPVNKVQAKALTKVAGKAPFGKGGKTMLDNSVRSAWEIDAAKLAFNGNRWSTLLNNVLSSVKRDLGLEDYTISAHLYKMLIYEKGDFFLPHKDSEKEKGMFGTLIMGLPSRHKGGELVVSFDGVEEVADFAQGSDDYKINYTAFYADCDHEVKPLISGYRICLVYNLIQQKSGKRVQLAPLETYVAALTKIFTKQQQHGHSKPHIVLLGHQYTPENFSMEGLKLNDRPKAEVLLRAAGKAGCYAKMCLVTSYLAGMPEDDGRYYGYHADQDEDAVMEEVYDESLSIEYWLENDIPALSNVDFEEDDLITSFALKDGEPIVKEATGYMGNYGPDLMHWYHYGAVVIWSPEVNAQLLQRQNNTSKLEWIGYFGRNPEHHLSDDEITAVGVILSSGLDNGRADRDANYNAIADWVVSRKDKNFFFGLDNTVCQFYFTRIDSAHWVRLIGFFPSKITEGIFALVTQNITVPVVGQFLSILRALSTTGKFGHLVSAQMKKLPQYFSALPINQTKKHLPTTSAALNDILWLEDKIPQDKTWVERMTEVLSRYQTRNYINQVLVPPLLAIAGKTALAHKLLLTCQQYLQERVNNEPKPPSDWSRQVPSATTNKKYWQLLKAFLESPHEKVFDYRKRLRERNELENVINHAAIDLKTETIRTGSPHILRITKTKAAYQREKKSWKEDVDLLDKVNLKMRGS